MTRPILTPLAASLPATVPFVGPEVQERATGQAFAARLGANENVFGPSPKAVQAMAEAGHWMYGDSQSYDLRSALATRHGTTLDHIVIGEGIDGLLGYLVRLTIGAGDSVVTSLGAYPTFNYHVAGFGGTLHTVPYVDDHEDPTALFSKAAEVGAKLVYLANPDNPMGTAHSGEVIAKAMEQLPDDALLILDEAYIECADEGFETPLPIGDPRFIRMRTFSKAYGLAGCRVGYAMGAPDLIAAFDRVRNHFGMSRASQAGALAALMDEEWLAHVRAEIKASRSRIVDIAKKHGLKAIPSQTNFVTIDCEKDGNFARAILSNLVARGIFVRMPFAAPQDRCIRVSCGTAAMLDAFDQALGPALNDAALG